MLANGMGVVGWHIRTRFEHASVAETEAVFAKHLGRSVVMIQDPVSLGPTFGLQAKELRFAETTLDGARSVGEAVTGSPIGRLGSLRLIAFLMSLGAARFEGAPASPARDNFPRRASTETGVKATVLRGVDEQVQLLRQQNHFEVVGVHWSAHYRTFRGAYDKAKARFDVTKPPLKDAGADVHEQAKEAIQILDVAYESLMNDEERVRYRKKLLDATERQYSADMRVKQGKVMILCGDRVAGIEAFETAVELARTQRNKEMLTRAREGKPI